MTDPARLNSRYQAPSGLRWPPPGDRCFNGIWFDVYHREIKLDNERSVIQETISCPDIARVYPIIGNSTLVMTDEYRHEIDRTVLRVVSGTIEPGESPASAAIRELGEELGFLADQVYELAVSIPMLKVNHKIHHFLAIDPLPGDQQLEYSERISPVHVPLAGLRDMAFSGDVLEDSVILGLLLLDRALRGDRQSAGIPAG